jgi:hypothetical protein
MLLCRRRNHHKISQSSEARDEINQTDSPYILCFSDFPSSRATNGRRRRRSALGKKVTEQTSTKDAPNQTLVQLSTLDLKNLQIKHE